MNIGIKLLIVGASNKSTRSIARSLKKENCECFVLNDEDLAVSKSKFVKEYILKPEIKKSILLFKDEVIAAILKYNINVVIPSTDLAVDVIMHFKEEIERHASVIGLNTPEVYKYAHNKHELLHMSREIGLTTPDYCYISTLDNLPDLDKLTYPVVVKPVSSAIIVNDRHYGFKVSFPKNKEMLLDVLRELVPTTPVMIQEYIVGYGIGYNIYAVNGEIKSEYIHKRLNENEGVSSYRKIIPIHSFDIKEKIHALIKRIKWNGVGMIEFRIDSKGNAYLMEMNGRFFGSTELGVKAGYDFPLFLYTHQFLKKPKTVNNTGKFYSLRMLHDEVLLELEKLIRTKNLLAYARWKVSLFNLFFPGNFLEDNLFEDPKFVSSLYRYDLRRIERKKLDKKRIKAIVIKQPGKEKWNNFKSVAFVCRGNICRSPFAALYASKIFKDKKCISLGTVNLRNRLSPMNALISASEFGIDLSKHQSKHIDDIQIEEIDAFVVMDRMNYAQLSEMGVPLSKLWFLGDKELQDPYRKSLEEYEFVYSEIKRFLDNLN